MHRWNIADTITSMRIAGSLALLAFHPAGWLFLILYTLLGITDVLDGYLARKTGTASDFGARLDSVADLLFYTVLAVKIAPILVERMPRSIWFAVAAAFAIRIAAYVMAFVKYHRFASMHTWLNKLTGFAVFLLPYVLVLCTGVVYGWIATAIGLLASTEELLMHVFRKEYSIKRKSIFSKAE
ncbi:MAG: CDP-alcohol phosphatidyltransferase family protein [Clostridia bacterium]|nr:CDP-alcohol phosphatidyltransferase family protein [Clostridia bacterium]